MPDRGKIPGADPKGLPRFVLSERQTECLGLAALGYTERQIAETLGVAHGTVRNHLLKARLKLGGINTTHAVFLAMKSGFDPEGISGKYSVYSHSDTEGIDGIQH